MNRNTPNDGEKVTMRFFYPEELHLMRNCLIAATDDTYVTDDELQLLTSTSRAEYIALLNEFGTMTQIAKKDWQTVYGLIGMLTNYPVDNQERLWAFLGVSRLHLSWFGDRMRGVNEHWLWCAEVSAQEVHARAEWLTSIDELVRPLNR